LWRFGPWGNLELGFDAGGGESCYPAGSAGDELAVVGWGALAHLNYYA
jgi:hypothetical protein